MGIVMGIFQVSSPLIVIIYLLRGVVWKSFLFTAVPLMRPAIASIRWWIMSIQNVARNKCPVSNLCAAPGHDTTQSTSRWKGARRDSASFQDIIEFSDNDDLWMKPQQVKRVKWVHDSAWWCMTTSVQTQTASSTSTTTLLQVEMFLGTTPLNNCELQISKWYVYIFHIFLAICLTILQKRGSFHTNILNICKLVYVYPRCRI